MKRFFCLLAAFMMMLTMVSCSSKPAEAEPAAFDLEAYKAAVNESRALINEAVNDLGNISNYQINYGKITGTMDESAAESAFKWFEEQGGGTRETVDADYDTIREQYKAIAVIDVEGNEAAEIRDAYVAMYENYINVYKMVTSPSGKVADFGNNVVENLKAVLAAEDTLSLFLD